MVIETLSQVTDKGTSTDWREGLVELPAGHVYGKTALTQQEWRRRAHKLVGQRFVVLHTSPRMSRRADSPPKSFERAMADLWYGLLYSRHAYRPDSGERLSMMTEAEWLRINREGRP